MYINIMFNSELKRIVVKGCNENDRDAYAGVSQSRTSAKSKMSCRLFSELLYKEMDWSVTAATKSLGYRIEFEGEAPTCLTLWPPRYSMSCKKKSGRPPITQCCQ